MNRNETKVKYLKNDRVQINMSIQGYSNICKYFNSFNDAMNEVGELMDFRMSEVRDMDYLRYALINHLGLERVQSSGYYSDFKIPNRSDNAES